MIYSRLMHVHVTRTGGTALREILDQIKGLEAWEVSFHNDYDTLAQWCMDNGRLIPPAITFSRNPWDWYLSMWSWLRTCRAGYWHEDFKDYLGIVHRNGRPDEALFKPFSWHWHVVQADKAQYFGQMENLRRDLIRILTAIMPDLVTAEQIGHIVENTGLKMRDLHPADDVTPGDWRTLGPYRQYYDDEAISWVFEMDKALIGRFNYEF